MITKQQYKTSELDAFYNSLIQAKKNKVNKIDNTDKKKRIKKALSDFQYFVNTYFKHFVTDNNNNIIPLADFHLDLIDKLKNKSKVEIAAEFPRGHGKSVVFSLFVPIWLALRGDVHLVLLISATQSMASKQLINIQVEFEANELLINDFTTNRFKSQGSWTKNAFVINEYDVKFTSAGKGSTIRGLRYNKYRPDLIIIDDIDDDKSTRNPRLIDEQTDWVLGSVLPAMEITNYKLIAVSNRYAHNMVFVNLSEIEGIDHIKINAINEFGEPVWKERFSLDDLNNIKRKIGSINFLREYMNTPVSLSAIFKDEWILIKADEINLQSYDTIVTYVDPSYKNDGDFKAVVTIGYINKKYHVLDILLKQTSMKNVIEHLYTLQDIYSSCNYNTYMEANFAQGFLHQPEFDKIYDSKGYPLAIIFDTNKKDNKIARIESMSSYFERNLISFSSRITETADFKIQLLGFSGTSRLHDDGPDAMQSAITKINGLIRHSKYKRKSGQIKRHF